MAAVALLDTTTEVIMIAGLSSFMKNILLITALVFTFAALSFAGSGTLPNAYCNQQVRSCFMDCCDYVPGGEWSDTEDDCIYDVNSVPDSTIQDACGSCMDTYLSCDATYNSDGSLRSGSGDDYSGGTSSNGGGCCGGAVIIGLIGVGAFFRRR